MQIIRDPLELQKIVFQHKSQHKTIGLVPTMGALHSGHLSLVRQAKQDNDLVVVSIFVNPTQFGPSEDLASYPKPFEQDKALLEAEQTDILFYPSPDLIYGKNYGTYVNLENSFLDKLCGAKRPGHFRGVSTIVAMLFNLAQPTKAYFGLKDYQQVLVIQQMVRDLKFPVQIVPMPIFREPDGLAMSSRNKYLLPEQRKDAPLLYQSLKNAQSLIEQGEKSAQKVKETIASIINKSPHAQIDYIEITHFETLESVTTISDRPVLIALAVFMGKARLIDNILI